MMVIWLVVWNMAFMNFHSVGNSNPNCYSLHHLSEGQVYHQPDILCMFLHVFIAGENKHVQLYTANWYGRITLICTNGPVWFCLSHERVQMFGYIDLSHTQTIHVFESSRSVFGCVHNVIYIYILEIIYIYTYQPSLHIG